MTAFARALEHHQAGRLAEAATLYQEILAADPNHADALHLLGVIANQVGQHALAVETITRAIALKPTDAAYHTNLGEALRQFGRLDDAVASLRRALALQPDLAAAHNNLGVALQAQGKLADAAASFARAAALDAGYLDAIRNLGKAHLALARWTEAAAALERARALDPTVAETYVDLGIALQHAGALDAAIATYDQALLLRPDNAGVHGNRAAALLAQGRIGEAIPGLRRALALAPDDADAHNNLGNALQTGGLLGDAAEHYRRALALRPGDADVTHNLGNALAELGDTEGALAAFADALALRPEDPLILNSRGKAELHLGLIAAARASFEAAVTLAPARAEIASNRLSMLNYDPSLSDAELLDAHRAFGTRFTVPGEPEPHGNARDPQRRLRIGYVSGDFGRHPVGYFAAPVLAAHARDRFEVYCYAQRATEDAMSARIRASVAAWRPTTALDDAALAAQIRADGIDLLIDLAGHTAHNRLPVFARRPAPIQLTWLGYPCPTGAAGLDGRLTDAIVDPPDAADAPGLEPAIRLPDGFHCYVPPEAAPSPAPLPARAAGAVTFGSFNNLAKINDAVLTAWRRILAALPDSRLVLKGGMLADPRTRAGYAARLAAAGLAPDRVALIAPARGWPEHMGQYHAIDIGLDPFPYNGTTTTCDALWMGVPVVTLAGTRHAARVGASLLAQLGLDRLVARDVDGYVETAVALARDIDGLAALRGELRGRIQAAPLGDPMRFTRALEATYRALWRTWSASQS